MKQGEGSLHQTGGGLLPRLVVFTRTRGIQFTLNSSDTSAVF